MPVVALALLGVLLLSGGVQVLYQSRAVGSSRFRLFGDRPGSAEWWSGWAVFTGFGCATAGPVLHLLGWVGTIGVLSGPSLRILGIVLWVAAALLARISQTALGRSWRIGVVPGERLALVRRGPYRAMRHPVYTALIVLLGAGVLIDPTWVSLAAVPLAVAGWEIQVRRVEEPYLMALHPGYREYRRAVGRFLPALGRDRRAADSTSRGGA